MLGSTTTPDRGLARDSARSRFAFRTLNNVGIRDDISWLNNPAWQIPCQRFAAAVADGLAHDSGPAWFAIPSLHWTLTNYSLPVSPAHSASRYPPASGSPGILDEPALSRKLDAGPNRQ